MMFTFTPMTREKGNLTRQALAPPIVSRRAIWAIHEMGLLLLLLQLHIRNSCPLCAVL